MKSLTNISDLIDQLLVDVRAEVLAASIIDEGVSEQDMIVYPRSTFKRRFSRDILSSDVVKLSDYFTALGLFLSRDGIYDTLPEGMFHKYTTEPLRSGSEMANESKRQRREEAEARKFFLPLENEMFFQRVQLEIEERKILHKISRSLFEDFFLRFWKIDRTLPRDLIQRMIILLPFANKVAGNLDLAGKCLEAILQEPVKVETGFRVLQIQSRAENEEDPHAAAMGQVSLGSNFILGESYSEMIKEAIFRIGPITNSKLEDYLGDGQNARFIGSFFEFFVPIELEAEFTVDTSSTGDFVLSAEGEKPVLGYNTII